MKEHITLEVAKLLKDHSDSDNYFKYFSTSDPSWYVFHEDVMGYDPRKDEDFLIESAFTPTIRHGLPIGSLPSEPNGSFTTPYDSWKAPILSKVRRFLREEHSIHISIQPYMLSGMKGDNLRYSYEIIQQVGPTLNNHKFETGFETYEDAMNRGLFVSLEILKNS